MQLERQGMGSEGRRAGVTESRTVEPGTKNRCGLCLRKITIGDGGSFLAIPSSQ